MISKEVKTINRLLKLSKGWANRKQVLTLILKGAIILLLFTIAGAIIGQLVGIGKLYGLIPGIIVLLFTLHFQSESFFKKEVIAPLRLQWLERRKNEQKNNTERLRFINKAEKIIESE